MANSFDFPGNFADVLAAPGTGAPPVESHLKIPPPSLDFACD
jgi:hypothetical protein